MDFGGFFMVFDDFLDHPLASRITLSLPFRPENLLSRALEGVVRTAVALVSQEHHLRQASIIITLPGGKEALPALPEKSSFFVKVLFLL